MALPPSRLVRTAPRIFFSGQGFERGSCTAVPATDAADRGGVAVRVLLLWVGSWLRQAAATGRRGSMAEREILPF